MPRTDTVIVGAGQAGLALSRYLALAGHRHVVLERGRIGERWRSERWDSLTLLSPNWLNVLPGGAAHDDPLGFLARDAFVSYLQSYADSFDAPVIDGIAVTGVGRGRDGFRVEGTNGRAWTAGSVVVATGDCDLPRIPSVAAAVPSGIAQLHSTGYRAPDALPAGGVLVVGAGPTGQQLALELRRAGRDVVIAVGRHTRSPRRYRGRDIMEWLALSGHFNQTIDELPDPQAARRSPSPSITGANGGERLDLGVLADHGVVVAGRLEGFRGRTALFAGDLADSLADAQRRMWRMLSGIDSFLSPSRMEEGDTPPAINLSDPPRSLDLRRAGISTILWATGYRRSYPWLRVPALGPDGEVVHRRGVTAVPGLYVLGQRLQYRRSSHFIGGVGEDARYVADCLLEPQIGVGPRGRLEAA